MSAMDDLNALLSNLPGYALLTEGMKQAALDGALIPDPDEVWPGSTDPLYVATYDVYFAALNLLGFLMAQPVVRSTSSEGTSVTVDAPGWSALANYYRSMSSIVQATGSNLLTKVLIPDGPHVRHTNMSEAVNGYDNVDTDLD